MHLRRQVGSKLGCWGRHEHRAIRLWKDMAGRSWTRLVQESGVPQVEALQLLKSIAALMREMGPRLGDVHWKESTRLGRESKVLPEEATGVLEAARTARRLREPDWCGDKGHTEIKGRFILKSS